MFNQTNTKEKFIVIIVYFCLVEPFLFTPLAAIIPLSANPHAGKLHLVTALCYIKNKNYYY